MVIRVANTTVPFERAGDILLTKYHDLLAQGHSPDMVEAAMRRCINWAERLTRDMPDNIREDAYISLLTKNLESCNDWITRYNEAMVAKV